MYTSDIKVRTESIAYGSISLFVLIFGQIYEHFSHGVRSGYMIFAFLIPLLGGALTVFYDLMLRDMGRRKARPVAAAAGCVTPLIGGAVAWLTLGSIYEGVLQIYGTTNRLVVVFAIVGTAQALAALLVAFCSMKK